MKKNLLVIFALMLISINLLAQKGKVFIDISSTLPSYPETVLSADGYDINQSGTPGQIDIGYFLNDRISMSIALNSSTSTTKSKDYYGIDDYGNYGYLYSYSFKLAMASIMLHSNYYYIANEKWNLSSGIGIGIVAATVTSTVIPSSYSAPNLASASGFAWQVNAIEAKYYFIKNLGLHTKLGIGVEGIISAGITVRF